MVPLMLHSREIVRKPSEITRNQRPKQIAEKKKTWNASGEVIKWSAARAFKVRSDNERQNETKSDKDHEEEMRNRWKRKVIPWRGTILDVQVVDTLDPKLWMGCTTSVLLV